MGKQSTVIQVKLDAEITELQKKVKLVGQTLEQFGKTDSTDAMRANFEQLKTALENIQTVANQPIDVKGMEDLYNQVNRVGTGIDGLLTDFKELKSKTESDKIELLSPDAQQQLEKVRSAITSYETSINDVKNKQEQLNTAKQEDVKLSQQIAAGQKKLATLNARQSTISKKKTSGQEKLGKMDESSAEAMELKASLDALDAEYRSNIETIQSYTSSVSKLQAEKEQLNATINKLNSEYKEGAGASQAQVTVYNELYKAADKLGISLEGVEKQYTDSGAEELLSRLRQLEKQGFDQLDDSIDKNITNLKECSTAQKQMEKSVESSNRELKEQDRMMENVSTLQGRISQYIGMEGIINALTQSLRAAFETVKELDASMTEMAVVTDKDIGDYWQELPKYTERADELGLVINDVYQADMLYYQQGLKTNEVVAVSAETMKMAKIAGLETADATDRMTAALRGFNMEINEVSAQRISDVYSELAAITASDVDEISTAMTKTASIASSAGMEFETTAAFLSQIIETTREAAETAGTALKTVIARFQELKKDPADIGEVDGEIVDANQIETALRTVGVALRDSSGQFRELDDVFLELASKWDSLDKNTQRYIATIAAGSRQQSRFIAMMSDYSRTQELVAAANNSAGASAAQYEKTVESLETKLNKLKNAWDTFTMGLMNNEIIKVGIDLLTGLINIINKFFESLDNISPIVGFGARVGLIIGGLMLLDKVIHNFFISLQAGNGILKSAGAALTGYSLNADGVRISTNKSTIATQKNAAAQQQAELIKRRTAIANAKAATSEAGYVGVLNASEKALYDVLVAEGIKNGLTEETAKDKAKQVALEMAYLNSLNAEEKELYQNTLQTALAAGASEADAKATAKAVITTNAETASEKTNTKEKKKNILVTIKEGIARGITNAKYFLSAIGLQLSTLFTKKDNAAKLAAIPANISYGASITLIVIAILLAIAAIAGFIILIFKLCGAFDTASKKHEQATKELQAIEEAVNNVKEEYNQLNEAFDELDRQQDALENLRRGTQEWNDAVKDLNSSVLDLVDQYPELANLVQNDGGVLKIDLQSEEAQSVIKNKERQLTTAQGAEIGAKMRVAELNAQKDYEMNHELIDDFSNTMDDLAGIGVGAGTALGAGAIGAGTGAAIGAAIGVWFFGVGAAAGAGVGAWIGGIAGLIAGTVSGVFTGMAAEQAALLSDAVAKENIDILSKAYASGEIGTTRDDLIAYIENEGLAVGEAARQMADAFLKNKDTLLEYGRTLNETDAQMEAYYLALATNAQQMIDLGKYTETQIQQMSSVVDDDLAKAYVDANLESLKDLNDEQFEKEKREYAKSAFGATARVDGDKIINEKGETLLTFEDKEGWKQQIAAAKATQQAAEAMQLVPDMIGHTLEAIQSQNNENIKGMRGAVEKALTGKSLTNEEYDAYVEAMGAATYFNSEGEKLGTEEDLKEKYENDVNLQNVYNTFENYKRSLDADFSGIEEMWKRLSASEKKTLYNDDYELFEEEFIEITIKEEDQRYNAKRSREKLGIQEEKVSGKLDSQAMQAWFNNLLDISTNAGDVNGLNDALTKMLEDFSAEQASAIMTQINAIDQMDKGAWEELRNTFEQIGITIPNDELDAFIQKGIEVSGAIRKIDFSTLANDVNETYKLLDKVKQGGRKYSEEDYKAITNGNKALEKMFTKVGDDFIYVGGKMQTLTEAIEKNTTAQLQGANRQLNALSIMTEAMKAERGNFGTISVMDEYELIDFLITMRNVVKATGQNIAEFGIKGLGMWTQFEGKDKETLLYWAESLATEIGLAEYYKTSAADSTREANIQRYTHNEASYNAEMATTEGEYADEHMEALLRQAILSGGVSNALIEQYRGMIDQYYQYIKEDNTEAAKNLIEDLDFKELSNQIAASIEKIVESNEGRDAYSDLVDRVIEALEQQQQVQIDKLGEINESINEANDNLLNKIQQQIDEQRAEREDQKARENISDMYTQRAYLNMDTSGANDIALIDLENQIADAEQDYQDSLIDDALQKLQDANDQAAEQRERQIALLEDQLQASYNTSDLIRQAEYIVQQSMEELKDGVSLEATKLAELLFGSEGNSLTGIGVQDWWSDFITNTTQAFDWIFALTGEPETGPGEQGTLDKHIEAAQQIIYKDDISSAENFKQLDTLYNDYASEAINNNATPVSRDEFVSRLHFPDYSSDRKNNIINSAEKILTDNKILNQEEASQNTDIQELLRSYTSEIIGGTEEEFWGNLNSKYFKYDAHNSNQLATETTRWWNTLGIYGSSGINHFTWNGIEVEFNRGDYMYASDTQADLNRMYPNPQNGSMVLFNDKPYLYYKYQYYVDLADLMTGNSYSAGGWYDLEDVAISGDIDAIIKKLQEEQKALTPYKTGGLADFTGPAWLDGTPSKPEYILNAAQTERFFSLVDVLEGIDKKDGSTGSSGDNYFDININVEKLDNDYDVEQVADKIRRIIAEDATYRNVNAINHIR